MVGVLSQSGSFSGYHTSLVSLSGYTSRVVCRGVVKVRKFGHCLSRISLSGCTSRVVCWGRYKIQGVCRGIVLGGLIYMGVLVG